VCPVKKFIRFPDINSQILIVKYLDPEKIVEVGESTRTEVTARVCPASVFTSANRVTHIRANFPNFNRLVARPRDDILAIIAEYS